MVGDDVVDELKLATAARLDPKLSRRSRARLRLVAGRDDRAPLAEVSGRCDVPRQRAAMCLDNSRRRLQPSP